MMSDPNRKIFFFQLNIRRCVPVNILQELPGPVVKCGSILLLQQTIKLLISLRESMKISNDHLILIEIILIDTCQNDTKCFSDFMYLFFCFDKSQRCRIFNKIE